MTVHADQNILLFSVAQRKLVRQLIGFNDEIIDATFLSPIETDSHIAVAANSSLIRIYPVDGNDARLLSGHDDMVLCLDSTTDGKLLVSGSKDNTARLWTYSPSEESWRCCGICSGHAGSVGAVALSRTSTENDPSSGRFLFTGSQDRTIKMWDLGSLTATGDEAPHYKSLATHKAHDKDINSLDVSPNNQLLASGSQDRTAKIYEVTYTSTSSGARGDIKLLGVCKGHKRGVWTVRFWQARAHTRDG